IWCSTLWDLTYLLGQKVSQQGGIGFDPDLYTGYDVNAPITSPARAGNKLALQLVMDATKLQPANPSFVDAPDALLAADLAPTRRDDFKEIWPASARRGLGLNAATANSNSDVFTADFTTPPFGVISGQKFEDINANGIQDAGEPGVPGFTI